MLGRWGAEAAGSAEAAERARPGGPARRAAAAAAASAFHGEEAASGRRDQRGAEGIPMQVEESEFQAVRNGTPMDAAERAARSLGEDGQRMPKRGRNYWADLSEMPEEDDEVPSPREQLGEAAHDSGHAVGGGGVPGPAAAAALDEARRRDDHADEKGDDVGEAREEDLRAEWQRYCQVCRGLERDPATPARLLADARSQRDEAERRWRTARTPHPLHKRMRWAEADLRDAETKQRLHQRELDAHVEQSARRTRELEARQRVDEARTARKRAALLELHKEGAPRAAPPPAEKAARIAVAGMGDVIPPLVAAVQRLAMPLGEDAEAFRHELRSLALAATRIEGVLREAVEQTSGDGGPARFDIGGDDGGCDGGAEADAVVAGAEEAEATGAIAPSATPPSAAAPRWTRQQEHGPWKRATSSEAAQRQAKRLLAQAAVVPAAAPAASGESAQAELAAETGERGDGGQAVLPGAATNDLSEAERRAREVVEEQFRREVLQRHCSDLQRQREEEQREQRLQRQQEELRRHQDQLQRANEARAAEEARQRDALLAGMSPAELARAAELHAQQLAVGSRAFGSQEASELAGLAHQRHVATVASAMGAGQGDESVDALMAMSPEQFAEWERDRQGLVADGAGW